MREEMKSVKELLKNIRHYALATVNSDGTPHNTPLFCMLNEGLSKIYWGSHPDSLHSKNIQRTHEGYVTIYDSITQGKGGLYLTLKDARCVTSKELPEALRVHNLRRAAYGKQPLDLSYYQAPNVQKMWVANVVSIEVYGAIRDESGHIYKEERMKTSAEEIVND
jgi:hypothetical protein